MTFVGRISGINKSRTEIYIIVLDFGTYKAFKASYVELCNSLLEKMRSNTLIGTSVRLVVEDLCSNRAFRLEESEEEAFDINEAAMDKVNELLKRVRSDLMEPPEIVEPGKYRIAFMYKGHRRKSLITWTTNPENVIDYLAVRF